jgi:hypothetical protein
MAVVGRVHYKGTKVGDARKFVLVPTVVSSIEIVADWLVVGLSA